MGSEYAPQDHEGVNAGVSQKLQEWSSAISSVVQALEQRRAGNRAVQFIGARSDQTPKQLRAADEAFDTFAGYSEATANGARNAGRYGPGGASQDARNDYVDAVVHEIRASTDRVKDRHGPASDRGAQAAYDPARHEDLFAATVKGDRDAARLLGWELAGASVAGNTTFARDVKEGLQDHIDRTIANGGQPHESAGILAAAASAGSDATPSVASGADGAVPGAAQGVVDKFQRRALPPAVARPGQQAGPAALTRAPAA